MGVEEEGEREEGEREERTDRQIYLERTPSRQRKQKKRVGVVLSHEKKLGGVYAPCSPARFEFPIC